MDDVSKEILSLVGITSEQLHGQLIPREILLNNSLYADIKKRIPELKKLFSSSAMTSLQESAESNQRWPLLNLVRQILSTHNYKMEPIRKSDGYTLEGVKKYKRYFLIKKKSKTNTSNLIKKIELDLDDDNEDINEDIIEPITEPLF